MPTRLLCTKPKAFARRAVARRLKCLIACCGHGRSRPAGSYPLVLFLHGAGEAGSDNREQLIYLPTWLASAENRRQYPAFVVAPQCPTGMQWSNIAWSNRRSEPLAGMSRPMQAVVGMLDELMER